MTGTLCGCLCKVLEDRAQWGWDRRLSIYSRLKFFMAMHLLFYYELL